MWPVGESEQNDVSKLADYSSTRDWCDRLGELGLERIDSLLKPTKLLTLGKLFLFGGFVVLEECIEVLKGLEAKAPHLFAEASKLIENWIDSPVHLSVDYISDGGKVIFSK